MGELCPPRAAEDEARYPKASQMALLIYMWATCHLYYSQDLGDWFSE